MKYPCKLIRDLLPLYHDGVCSEESSAAVEAHLADCEECQTQYQALRDSDRVAPAPAEGDDRKADALRQVKRKLNRKKLLACALAVVLTAALCVGVGMFLTSATVYEPADVIESVELAINVEQGGEVLLISAQTNNQGITWRRAAVIENNEEIPVLVCSFPKTLWECITVSSSSEPDTTEFSIPLTSQSSPEPKQNQWDSMEAPGKIQRLYYYDKSTRDLSPAELAKALPAEGKLLWSRQEA